MFLVCAAMNVAGWVFVYVLVSETKGRVLADIEQALMRGGKFKRNLDEAAA